jgi:hypothetical protein
LAPEVDVRGDAHATVGVHQTADQSPSRASFQVSVWVPIPDAEAAQKDCSVGGACGAPPVTRQICDAEGIEVEVLDIRVCDGSEIPGNLRLWPMPMKSVSPAGLSPRIRTLPNQLSIQDPSLSVGVNLKPRAREGVGRGSRTARSASSG